MTLNRPLKINIFLNNQMCSFETKIDIQELTDVWYPVVQVGLNTLIYFHHTSEHTVNGIYLLEKNPYFYCLNLVTEGQRICWHWLKVKFPALILNNFLCFNGPLIQPNLYNHTLKFPVGIETITKSAKDMSELC